MATTIEQLELEVTSSSGSAVSGIESLVDSLDRLKSATKGGMGLRTVAKQLSTLNDAVNTIDGSTASKISTLAASLDKLNNLGNLKLSSTIATNISAIGKAAASISTTDFSGIERLATSLSPLSSFSASGFSSAVNALNKLPSVVTSLNNTDLDSFAGRLGELTTSMQALSGFSASGFTSTINALNKLPKLAETLDGLDLAKFTSQIQQLSDALSPLSSQLDTIGTAFGRLPSNLRSAVSATNRITEANERASTSYLNLYAKAKMAMGAVRGIAHSMASWITDTNQYIEDVNLFSVSMGEYAEEASKYADTIAEAVGIDPGEFMRNEGTLNTIISGFGVASDKAYLMSKNLTQLGYDLSSFYNISTDEAMRAVQSGIAGELEPLRRRGYDLSVARLQQEAYTLGIKKSVSAMTQAEKSQLRYYAIMTQVKDVQGDMARTLKSPANQLRVFRAQVTQLSRAMGNLFIPVLNAVLPYLIAIAKVLRTIVETIAKFFNIDLPKVEYTSGVDQVVESMDDLGDSTTNTTSKINKLKKSIMGFDELNLLNDNSADSDNLNNMLDSVGGDLGIDLPEYDFLSGLVESNVDKIIEIIRGAMWEIEAAVSVFALAIGTILVVSGANIPLGLGLMAIGAVGLAAAVIANWKGMSEQLAKVLTSLMGALSLAMLAVGAVLVFSGANVPLGIGLMILGATGLATVAAIDWKFLSGNISAVLASIMMAFGGAFLALGAILAFSGANIPLGIALMATGAGLMATGASLNWEIFSNEIKAILSDIEGAVGGAFLALGAFLTLTGVAPEIGIPLLAAGAALIVSAIAMNWDGITSDLRQALTFLTSIISVAALALGTILLWFGVNKPLAIALIAAGAVGLISAVALHWDAISSEIKAALKALGVAVGIAFLALGAILTFTSGSIPMGVALLVAGAGSLVAGVALNWNAISNKVKELLKAIGGIVGPALLTLGVILVTAGALPMGIALIAAGAVNLVSAIALNWNAIVNAIKSLFTTIVRLFTGVALVALGLMLCGTVVGLPLGIGLIAAGASALTKPQTFNVQNLVNIGKQAVEGIKTGVKNAWDSFVTFWQNCFKGIVDWVKNFLGIHSPSTVFQSIGSNLVSGLANGMKNLSTPFSSAFKTISGFISKFGTNMYTWGKDMMHNMVTGINSGLSSLASAVSSAASRIRSYLHFSQPDIGPLSDFNTWMPDMMSQLADGIAKDEYKVQREVDKLAQDMNIESQLKMNVSAYGAQTPTTKTENESGIATAIYDAVVSAMTSGRDSDDTNTPIIVNLGNEQIASFLVKQNKRVALISGGRT